MQSADASVLNRVTGHTTGGQISRIMGTLNSEGHVYVINPQGIIFGKDATINVGSLIASTFNITNADFFALSQKSGESKDLQVLFSGKSRSKVLNLGKIQASCGDVYVIAYEAANEGSIEALKGSVALAAGSEVVLQPSNNRKVLIKTKSSAEPQERPGIEQSGVIRALQVELGADGNLYKLAINQSGHIEAKSLKEEGGKIFLVASEGSIESSGKLSTHGKKGQIKLDAGKITLTDKSIIDAKASSQVPSVVLGDKTSDVQIDPKAQIKASGKGQVVVKEKNWSPPKKEKPKSKKANAKRVSSDKPHSAKGSRVHKQRPEAQKPVERAPAKKARAKKASSKKQPRKGNKHHVHKRHSQRTTLEEIEERREQRRNERAKRLKEREIRHAIRDARTHRQNLK